MKNILLLILVFITTSFATAQTTNVIATGASWKYWDTGSLPSTDWNTLAYTDAAWNSGVSQLGYGDNPPDEATIVGYGTDVLNKYPTTYFRKTISITNSNTVTVITGRVKRDDGAVIYFNGTEVLRSNMPAGSVGYATYASTQNNSDENTWFDFTVPVSLLQEGNNVISVEIHQFNPGSSDLTFDLELATTISNNPTTNSVVINEIQAANDTVIKDNTGNYED